jgi:hypothetical protein
MFAGKAGTYLSEAPFTRKHLTRLEKLARDKHTSLLQKSENYVQKSFITLAPLDSLKAHFANTRLG